MGRGGILIPFVLTFVALSVASPSFLRFQNLTNILDQQAGIIIVACAGTLVLIAGGIDLSIGAIYGLAGGDRAQRGLVGVEPGRASWPGSPSGSPSGWSTGSS